MKIIKSVMFILPSLRIGGAEKVFKMLATNWAGTEKVHLVVIEPIAEVKTLQLQFPLVKITSLNKSGVLKGSFALFRCLRKVKPDIVYSTISHVNILTLIATRFLKTKVIIRESSVFGVRSDFSSKQRVMRFLIRQTYPWSTFMVCQSEDIKLDLQNEVPDAKDKMIVINNPIRVDDLPKKNNAISKQILQLVHVGGFRKEKGHERLLNILKQIKRPYHLTFIGDGKLSSAIKTKTIQLGLLDNVSFAGAVNPPFDLVSQSHLYIQTSFVEGFPNALLEALAIGVPAIAYDVPGGTREIINDFNGQLIKDGDEKSFALAVDTFDSTQYEVDKIREDIKDRFDIGKIVKAYRNLAIN